MTYDNPEKEIDRLRSIKGSYEAAGALLRFWDSAPDPVLQRNEHSRLHLLKEAAKIGGLWGGEGWEDPHSQCSQFVDQIKHTFVVRHDWGAMVSDLEDGDIRLPYEICAFEFMISGFPVIAVCIDEPANEFSKITLFMALKGFWCPFNSAEGNATGQRLLDFCWRQIRSICVALDAEAATHEVVRASQSLNAKREKKGKLPLPDYRVVDIARRVRVANPSNGESGRRVRLHFRRGHWRHYEDHRTWIRWQLVGNPDLGFVDKQYRL